MNLPTEIVAVTESALATSMAVAIVDPDLRNRVTAGLGSVPATLVGGPWHPGTLAELLAWLERLSPDILLLGLPDLAEDPAVVLRAIARLRHPPRVVVVNDSAEPELILQVMRAGAAEFVYPPLETRLGEAVNRAISDHCRAAEPERIAGAAVGFVSAKGGCGATTIACHAAGYLRSEKMSVLLADLDTSSGMVGQVMRASTTYSFEDAVQHVNRMDLKLWRALASHSPSGVDVIPAALFGANRPGPNRQGANRDPMGSVELSAGARRLLSFWRGHYEFTLVDLGQGVSHSLLGVLDALDGVVLVSTTELPALRQAGIVIQALTLRGFSKDRLRLLVNRMPRRAEIQTGELEKLMGHPVYAVLPNDYRTLTEAYAKSRLADFDSAFGHSVANFAARMAGLQPPSKKTRGFWFGYDAKGN